MGTSKTIALGQTKDEVVGILGQPQKIANLGAKEIYYYADMKVTFVNGKVSNVESLDELSRGSAFTRNVSPAFEGRSRCARHAESRRWN
jgi:hypothetical protein